MMILLVWRTWLVSGNPYWPIFIFKESVLKHINKHLFYFICNLYIQAINILYLLQNFRDVFYSIYFIIFSIFSIFSFLSSFLSECWRTLEKLPGNIWANLCSYFDMLSTAFHKHVPIILLLLTHNYRYLLHLYINVSKLYSIVVK